MTVTISRILRESGEDPVAWENAGTREQIMVVLCWGRDHGKNFKCGELCELLGLPGDVVLTVLEGLADEGLVLEVVPYTEFKHGVEGS